MEIKVVCSAAVTSGINDGFIPSIKICGNLKDAFWFKDYLEQDAELFGFDAAVILQTAHRTIEVRKEHPRWCVCIEDPAGVLDFRPFYTDFEHGLNKCLKARDMGLNAVLYVKSLDEGWKSWWTFNPLG